MTDEQMWLLCFGRGWVDKVDIEDADPEVYSMYIRLASESEDALTYDLSLYRVKLREK